jgi:hypothetical protein
MSKRSRELNQDGSKSDPQQTSKRIKDDVPTSSQNTSFSLGLSKFNKPPIVILSGSRATPSNNADLTLNDIWINVSAPSPERIKQPASDKYPPINFVSDNSMANPEHRLMLMVALFDFATNPIVQMDYNGGCFPTIRDCVMNHLGITFSNEAASFASLAFNALDLLSNHDTLAVQSLGWLLLSKTRSPSESIATFAANYSKWFRAITWNNTNVPMRNFEQSCMLRFPFAIDDAEKKALLLSQSFQTIEQLLLFCKQFTFKPSSHASDIVQSTPFTPRPKTIKHVPVSSLSSDNTSKGFSSEKFCWLHDKHGHNSDECRLIREWGLDATKPVKGEQRQALWDNHKKK